jgi:hypothetical protein
MKIKLSKSEWTKVGIQAGWLNMSRLAKNICPVCKDPDCNHICFYKPTLDVLTKLTKEYKLLQIYYNKNQIKKLNKLLSQIWFYKNTQNIFAVISYYKDEIINHYNGLLRMEKEHPELKEIRINEMSFLKLNDTIKKIIPDYN